MTGDEQADGKRWHLSTAAIAGLVAVASGVVTLAFTLAPWLKPDPGLQINGSLRVLTVEPHAVYKDFLARLGDGAPVQKDRSVLGEKGYVTYLRVDVNGRKRRDVELRQATYLVGSGRRYDSDSVLGFKSDTPSDRWVATAFVIDPGVGQDFFVRYELVDRGTILAIADTHALKSVE